MGRKKREEVVVETATIEKEELVVTSTERDEAFHKAHTGARDEVIYG